MKKELNIMGKGYEVELNALTPLLYKKTFKRGLMQDLGKLNELNLVRTEIEKDLKAKGFKKDEIEEQISIKTMANLDDFVEIITQFAYILILGNDKNFKSYEDWLSEQDTLALSDDWVKEVTELAVASFQ